VAQVGALEIHRSDVALRDQVSRVYYPTEQRSVGLQQLVHAYLAAEVLRRYDFPTDAATLAKEAERIDRETHDRAILTRIQSVFENNSAAYLRLYVLPVYAERTICNDFFLHDPRTQQASHERATRLLKAALSYSGSLKTLASHEGYEFARIAVTREAGTHADAPPSDEDTDSPPPGLPPQLEGLFQSAGADEGRMWIDELVPQLKPGKVFEKLVDHAEAWLVVRYLGREDKRHRFELIAVAKDSCGKWLDAERSRVPLRYFTDAR
jgi:hypothetical protein